MQYILKLTVAAILLILPSVPLAPSWNTLCILYILLAFSSGSSWFSLVLPCLILTSPSTYSSQVIASTSWLQLLSVVGLKPLPECCLYRNTLPSGTSLIHSTPWFTIHDNKEILKSQEGYFYLEEALLLPRDLFGLRHKPISSLVMAPPPIELPTPEAWNSPSLDLRTKIASL